MSIIAAVMLLMAFSGCASKRDESPAPQGPARPVLVRHDDGSTELIEVRESTGLILGSVQDIAAMPLGDVRVSLAGSQDTQATTASGRFLFDGLAPGTYELRAESAGYRPAKSEIRIGAGDVARVRVTMAALEAISSQSPSGQSQPFAPLSSNGDGSAAIPTVEVPTWPLYPAGLVVLTLVAAAGVRRARDPARTVARGRAALASGASAKAERLARTALARRPGDSDAWVLLGTSMIKRGAYQDAARLLERASAYYDPQIAGVAFLITLAYRRMGRPDAARPWLHLVARDDAYWAALNQDPEGALASWLNKGVVRRPVDPAYQ